MLERYRLYAYPGIKRVQKQVIHEYVLQHLHLGIYPAGWG